MREKISDGIKIVLFVLLVALMLFVSDRCVAQQTQDSFGYTEEIKALPDSFLDNYNFNESIIIIDNGPPYYDTYWNTSNYRTNTWLFYNGNRYFFNENNDRTLINDFNNYGYSDTTRRCTCQIYDLSSSDSTWGCNIHALRF